MNAGTPSLGDGSSNTNLTNSTGRLFCCQLPLHHRLLGQPISFPLDKTTGTFRYTRRHASLTGLTYTVLTSDNLSGWTQVTTATDIPGTDKQSVEVKLSPAFRAGAGPVSVSFSLKPVSIQNPAN